ncbi:MAG: ASKHA domain-containing protein [Synergistaceae bacterium]|nr:ASKHA domain-containing protein [Synergistaceae bacterium]
MKSDNTNIKVTTVRDGEQDIEAKVGANLLEVLRENNVSIAANCGGRGTCGKCVVHIDGEERLACQTEVTEGMQLKVSSGEESFVILEDYASGEKLADSIDNYDNLCIGVDIGTTTVVLQLIDAKSGKIASTRSFLNAQRQYGEDVISRIQCANEGDLDALTDAIRSNLLAAIKSLCSDVGVEPTQLKYICIAGNTTMMFLLLHYECQSLGVFPFEPEFKHKDQYTFFETFGVDTCDCPVYLVPWVSAYVGGDITAGYLDCRGNGSETAFLIDMGTNGEMMLWTKDKILCTSTAAGPAFEGGGITYGTGSIPGAISKIDYTGDSFTFETIAGEPPVGICGSGVLDASACLLRGEFVDETGRMEDPYFDEGVVIAKKANGKPILFTQKDVRELQLAKSAIRAGVEILLSEAGLTISQLDAVYLAGGFGQKLRIESAVEVGLLPEEMAQKVRSIGNSSLGGAVRICRDLKMLEDAKELAEKAEEIQLSAHPDFQNFFMDYMAFADL